MFANKLASICQINSDYKLFAFVKICTLGVGYYNYLPKFGSYDL